MSPDDPRPPRNVAPRDAHLVEEREASERVFVGKLLDVRRVSVRLPDGHTAIREYIAHPGAVVIVPMTDDDRVIVARQFRYPLNSVLTEFPAGKIDSGETPLETARRELREETGYAATVWTHLGTMHAVVSYSTETIALFLAQGLVQIGAAPEHGEFIETQSIAHAELVAAADRGEITDAKTLVALYLLSRTRTNDVPAARRLVVRGHVQGVGYRDGLVGAAEAAGIAGWVRNRRDGRVEALVQGDCESVLRLIAWARRGPSAARVSEVEVSRVSYDSALAGFEMRPTA